ncbi:MAG: imidazole glycerol phosphate synthase subunit HisH [Verrucomicrobiales bacterium]
MANIAVVDYGSGNLRSVRNALQTCGANVFVTEKPGDLAEATAVVLPGVGSFGDAMTQLGQKGLVQALKTWIHEDRPFFGICLGYQVLFEGSEESLDVPGLGVFSGRVKKFDFSQADPSDEGGLAGLKVPHMGWNQLHLVPTKQNQPEPLWLGLEAPEVYFVHSYYPAPEDDSLVIAKADYGVLFAAAIRRGQLVATQFHPEKSQGVGLAMLKNWLATVSTS